MVLNITKEEQIKRVFSRHGQPKELTAMLTMVFYSYEAVNVKKEINTIEILLTRGLTQEDVVNKMLANLDQNKESFLYDILLK